LSEVVILALIDRCAVITIDAPPVNALRAAVRRGILENAMGPFAMGDLAGLDIGWRSRQDRGVRWDIADAISGSGRLGGRRPPRAITDTSGDRARRFRIPRSND
jgi:3-hydroxyacyl-CoA dehydrogenase